MAIEEVDTPTDPTTGSTWTREDINAVYGWLPPAALDLFIDAWPESGNADVAWAQVRKDPRYEQWFPGNMTEDGRPRYSEDTYAAVTASYDDVFRAAGLGDSAIAQMRQMYGTLIAGDVAPRELEEDRVMPMYERIVESSEYIKGWYANEYGLGLSTEELLAGAMNPELGEKILQRQISFAEIGGEAAESGFDIDLEMIDRLYRTGEVDQGEAGRLFETAGAFLPVLNTLAKRHQDPDDEFDLEEFVNADIFADPAQRRRMRRLVAQEQAMFAGTPGSVNRSRQTGALTGLESL